MAMYKARHALVSWTDEDGSSHTIFRGQTGDIPEGEVKRLMPHGAIVGVDEELKRPGILQQLGEAPDDEELLNWMSGANASDVAELVTVRPELRPRVESTLAAVQRDRGVDDTHLKDIYTALSRVPAGEDNTPLRGSTNINDDENGDTGGFSYMVGGSTPATGRDTTAEGLDDIVLPPGHEPVDPAGQFATGGADGGAFDGDSVETNTPLEVPSTTDYPTLVSGSADEVASYISEHPQEANNVLEAETEATNGSPRAAVVLAARSAAQFGAQ